MYCLTTPEDMKFYGDYNTDLFHYTSLDLLPCETNCLKPKDLLDSGQWPYLVTLTNTQSFDPAEFDTSKLIEKSSFLNFIPINMNVPSVTDF